MPRNNSMPDTENLQTLEDFYQYGLRQAQGQALFFGHGTDNIHDELRWLLTASLGLPFDAESLQWQRPLAVAEKRLLAERLQGRLVEAIPVPYLINEAFFCDLSFYVDERVLIPRSPIAELIRQQFSPWIAAEKVRHVLDLCTGSGCIAMAMAHYFPQAQIDASDLSKEALAVAEMNRQRLGLVSRVQLIESDCWENIPQKAYDIIVSNPPYVGDAEMAGLPDEYRYEPDMALRAEDNGLAIVEKILQKAHAYLSDQGIIVVEVGNSADALQEKYPQVPFIWLEFAYGGDGVFLLSAAELQRYFGNEQL
ncbi:MAG: 50S ribosomal protein L3 N(5)-glutamine methyltransferase [Legionellaceae bacterium]|nr:50S ribosomal protein L3 N(5)-glutamine methyltransferase [Legionellaceae bacterium]